MKASVFFDSMMGLKSRIVINADKFTINPSDVKGWFELIEKPQIEVGSEWVATLAKQGEKTLIVLHVGQQMSLCKWVSDDREFSVKNTDFNTAYKPKPKTVTMNFYKVGGKYYAYSVKQVGEPLFTKEIEL